MKKLLPLLLLTLLFSLLSQTLEATPYALPAKKQNQFQKIKIKELESKIGRKLSFKEKATIWLINRKLKKKQKSTAITPKKKRNIKVKMLNNKKVRGRITHATKDTIYISDYKPYQLSATIKPFLRKNQLAIPTAQIKNIQLNNDGFENPVMEFLIAFGVIMLFGLYYLRNILQLPNTGMLLLSLLIAAAVAGLIAMVLPSIFAKNGEPTKTIEIMGNQNNINLDEIKPYL